MSENKQKIKKVQTPTKKHSKNSGNPFTGLAISVLAGITVFFMSAFLVTFLIEKSSDPCALLSVASLVCTIIASAVSGAVCAKLTSRPAPFSLISGLCMILVYLAISVFFESGDFENGTIFKTATVIILPLVAFLSGKLCHKNNPQAFRH